MTNQQELNYQYTGDFLIAQNGHKDPNQLLYYPYPYLPSPELKEAVSLAIALGRPLLLEGEPGCGKTRLAGAVAYEFTEKFLKGQKNEQGEEKWWDYYIWNIKSTTRARDGLYNYDAIARLRDAQLMGTDPQRLQEFLGQEETKKLKKRLQDKKNYREFGPLGKSLQEHSHRPILLIDEIDKADSDFANDLLLELEELRFTIPETEEEIATPKNKPIIFITSNREKPLPEPFLRRCLYFFVDFPSTETLKDIIINRFGTSEVKESFLTNAIKYFEDIRKILEDVPGSKQPGTSEFIDFFAALLKLDKKLIENKNAEESLKDLSKQLPLLGTLLKTKMDQQLYLNIINKS